MPLVGMSFEVGVVFLMLTLPRRHHVAPSHPLETEAPPLL
jgi:hypothetical protein